VTIYKSLPARFEIRKDTAKILEPTYSLILWEFLTKTGEFYPRHNICGMFSIKECGEAYSKIVGIMSRGEKWELAVEEYNKFTSDDTPD
jgi:hypothetical protein